MQIDVDAHANQRGQSRFSKKSFDEVFSVISHEMREIIEKSQLDPGNQLAEFLSESTPLPIVERYTSLPERACAHDYGEFDRNVVVLDTETTGFSLNHDELTQIAAARLENGEIVDWFITFVNPGKPIPEDVAHLTDIHDEDVADAPEPAEALAQLVEFVGDAKLVAHNADFDRSFTTKHPAGYPLLENIWLDSLDMARIALPRMKSHRLIDLVKAFGAPLSTHRADDDVAATCALYRILLAAIDAMPDMLVTKIADMADAKQWPTSVVFSHFARLRAAEREQRGELLAPLFSVRALRNARLGKNAACGKVDADQLAQNPDQGLSLPSEEEVLAAFSEQGLVGSLYENYETREEQLAMSKAVRSAFESSRNLVVEAGTGVGKSMAYLLPAALTACRNNITVGVATKTNALLDQLVNHELPALAEALAKKGVELTYAPLKGFANYPCLRRIERLAADGPKMRLVGNKESSQAPALAALLSYVEQTDYDDMSSLKMDFRLLPRYAVTTTSHDCLRRKCPFYGTSCFVHGARRRAEAANIVVTNHSMLFCDLAADGGLMPPIRYWVVDEAHGAENEARRALSLELVAEEMRKLATRVSSTEASRNVFSRVERAVASELSEEPASKGFSAQAGLAQVSGASSAGAMASAEEAADATTLLYALLSKAQTAGSSFAEEALEFASSMRDLLAFDDTKRGKGYESVELWLNETVRNSACFKNLAASGHVVSTRAEKLVTACQELVGYLEGVNGAAVVQREVASVAIELKELIKANEVILFPNEGLAESYVRSATLNKRGDKPVDKLEAMPYNVGEILNETFYARTHSVVFASATLTVGDSFDAFKTAMGLGSGEFSSCDDLKLASSYDFDHRMRVYVASDMPEPNDPQYLATLQRLLAEAHVAQKGSALTLFTNRKEMEKCFEEVQPALKAADLRLVCQKWGVSVKGLRDDFLADEHLSLFALKSFWEGFDAPGATLKAVIIPKLPFAKPTDPLSCERSARDDQAWRKYVLPAAVLETKQAAGRLIRKADDEGSLILADKRLITKSYGKAFLNSLPSKNIRVCTIAEIVEELRAQTPADAPAAAAAPTVSAVSLSE